MFRSKIFIFYSLVAIVFCKSLIDIEIDTTQELMQLYKNKSELLENIYELKQQKQSIPSAVNSAQFEKLLSRQEDFMLKRRYNLTDLVGFDDPFAEASPTSKSSNEDQRHFEKNKARLESLFHERIMFEDAQSNITQFELMNIKPLGKASSGGYMTQSVLLGIDNRDIIAYDIYQNPIFNASMAQHGGIKIMKGSHHHDDMYIVALSQTSQLWEFNITLQKLRGRGSKQTMNDTALQNSGTNATGSEKEDIFNKRYQGMFKLYNYVLGPENWVDLNAIVNQTDIEFKHMVFYMNKGEKYYLLSDNEGYINVFNRGLTLRKRIYSGEKEIVQLVKQSVTVIVVHRNDIRFIKFFKSTMGTQRCHSGMANLTNIVVDSNHNGYIYGATTTGEVLMFKTERLLQNVDNIKWSIQGKLKLHASSQSETSQVSIVSLKNFLLAFKSDGSVEMFDMTNTQEFLMRPIGYNIKLSHTHFTLDQGNLPQVETIKSFNGDLILLSVSNPGSNQKSVLYECLTPRLQEKTDFDFFNFKFPMFFIAFAVVLFFQFLNRKEGENNDILSTLLGICGTGRSERFKSKKQRQMDEVEELIKGYTK